MSRFVALVLGLLIAGCAMKPTENRDAGPQFPSLTPASLGRDLALSQRVTGKHDGNTYRARYEIELAGDRLAIVGLSPVGLTLFTLVQQGTDITVDNRFSGVRGFDPRYTLFDLYLTYWPANTLAPALEKIGMTLEIAAGGNKRTVRDSRGGRVATVSYTGSGAAGSVIEIEHFDRPYSIRIAPVKMTERK